MSFSGVFILGLWEVGDWGFYWGGVFFLGGKVGEGLSLLRAHAEMSPRLGAGEAAQLMVVSHADDEILFGGNLLEEGPWWLVVVVAMPKDDGEAEVRELELQQALAHFPWVLEVRTLGYEECSQCAPLHPEVYEDLKALLAVKWQRVVTHGPMGEYGHPQHRELHLAVKALCSSPLWVFQPHLNHGPQVSLPWKALEAYASQAHVLALYRRWASGAVPWRRFNFSQGAELCLWGAQAVAYYRRNCRASLPRHVSLELEAMAFPFKRLAQELAASAAWLP